MVESSFENKQVQSQAQKPEETFESYTTDSLVLAISSWQRAQDPENELGAHDIIVFPDDQSLQALVRNDLLEHLAQRSNDPFNEDTRSPEAIQKLLDEQGMAREEFDSLVEITAQGIKQDFGVSNLSGIQVDDGVIHYDRAKGHIVGLDSFESGVALSAYVLEGADEVEFQFQSLAAEGERLLEPVSGIEPIAIPPPLPVPSQGLQIDGVRDLERLGSGGMGTVYRCTIEATEEGQGDRQAVVKVMHEHMNNEPGSRARFEREAELLSATVASTTHKENFPAFIASGNAVDGVQYYAQELVPGISLHREIYDVEYLRNDARFGDRETQLASLKALHERNLEVLAVFPDALNALGDMHESGVVHRDLKPDNMVVVRNPLTNEAERLVVLDFGLAKRFDEPMVSPDEGPSTQRELTMVHGNLTPPDAAVGTPTFMSPEQHQPPALVTGKSDVFAAGLILYQTLTGKEALVPGNGMFFSYGQARYAAINNDFKSLHRQREREDPAARIHPEMEYIIKRMLDKDPERRPTMKEAAAMIESHLQDPKMPPPESFMERLRDAWNARPGIGDIIAGVRDRLNFWGRGASG